MRKFWMARDTPQCFRADVSFTNVPVPIDARVEGSTRIVEMDRPNISQTDCSTNNVERRIQSVFFTNVVAGSE